MEEKGYVETSVNEKGKLDFPFDLNNLFSLQYSFDQLKAAIEYLARQQGEHQRLINELLNREPGSVKIIERTETIPVPVSGSQRGGSTSATNLGGATP